MAWSYVDEELDFALHEATSTAQPSNMVFESAVNEALEATQRVLGANRKLALPSDVHRERARARARARAVLLLLLLAAGVPPARARSLSASLPPSARAQTSTRTSSRWPRRSCRPRPSARCTRCRCWA